MVAEWSMPVLLARRLAAPLAAFALLGCAGVGGEAADALGEAHVAQVTAAHPRANADFAQAMRVLQASPASTATRDAHFAHLRDTRVVFVPGYAWKLDPTTGADFARQRQLLTQLGVGHTLIETDELGSVEGNADIVFSHLRQLPGAVVIVSASKGGPEVALALERLAALNGASRVVGWVSVGGMMGGTPLADWACRWPMSWVAGLVLHAKGLNTQVLTDMRTPLRRAQAARLVLPRHLRVVQFVGVPTLQTVTPAAQSNYLQLATIGANDGLTLLSDQHIPGAQVVVQRGIDHYFRHPQIDLMTLAMLMMVTETKSSEMPSLLLYK